MEQPGEVELETLAHGLANSESLYQLVHVTRQVIGGVHDFVALGHHLEVDLRDVGVRLEHMDGSLHGAAHRRNHHTGNVQIQEFGSVV